MYDHIISESVGDRHVFKFDTINSKADRSFRKVAIGKVMRVDPSFLSCTGQERPTFFFVFSISVQSIL